jgi:hypothetical protein
MGLKAKNTEQEWNSAYAKLTKVRGKHQRIYIRRSLRFFLRLHFKLVKKCKSSRALTTLKNIYASGRVALNFNQSWKNQNVFLKMLLLDLFRQSEPCLTKLMIDVRSYGLISSRGLKQSLNHDVNLLNIRLG